MGPNKANPTDLKLKIEFHDKPEFITLYVENNSIVLQYTGTWIFPFQFVKVLEFHLFGLSVPRFQLLFTICVLCPKVSQGPFCDYSQIERFEANIEQKLPKR